MRIIVTRKNWRFEEDTDEVPAIKIRTPLNYLHIPISEARLLVDMVHDEVDRYDREQREVNQ